MHDKLDQLTRRWSTGTGFEGDPFGIEEPPDDGEDEPEPEPGPTRTRPEPTPEPSPRPTPSQPPPDPTSTTDPGPDCLLYVDVPELLELCLLGRI